MKILIIEDDENKGVQLSQFLHDTFTPIDLQLARSLQSGLRLIRQNRPNLVLLDMTIPNYDTGPDEPGGTTHIFGGREFLRQMERFDIDVPVIVVTQFETFGKPPVGLKELDAELMAAHPSVYRGVVYYHASIHGWKEELKRFIEQVSAGGMRSGGNA